MHRCFALVFLLFASKYALADSKTPHRVEFSGLLQFDASHFGEFYSRSARSDDDLSVRRLRLSSEYRYKKMWRAEIGFQYSERDAKVDLHQLRLRYRGANSFHFSAGKFKQPFGLQRVESAAHIKSIERAMVSSTLSPDRAWGFQVASSKNKHSWAVGVFQQEDDNNELPATAPQSITGRITWAPMLQKTEVLHLGASVSYVDWNNNPFRLRNRGEVNAADNIVRSARFNAKSQNLFGAEMAWRRKALHVQAEYVTTEVDSTDFASSVTYDGFYVEFSYLINAKRQKYKSGEFTRVKSDSDAGAFELLARYSEIDLRDGIAADEIGAEANSSLLGINWYWRKHLRVSLNYVHPDIAGDTLHQNLNGDAVIARMQLRF